MIQIKIWTSPYFALKFRNAELEDDSHFLFFNYVFGVKEKKDSGNEVGKVQSCFIRNDCATTQKMKKQEALQYVAQYPDTSV